MTASTRARPQPSTTSTPTIAPDAPSSTTTTAARSSTPAEPAPTAVPLASPQTAAPAAAPSSSSSSTDPAASAGVTATASDDAAAGGDVHGTNGDPVVDSVMTPATSTTSTPKPSKSRSSSHSRRAGSNSINAAAVGAAAHSPSAVAIPDEVVDSLPQEVEFPKKGYKLHPLDEQDSLLLMCARAVVTCNNRALTPKEIALICTRKWGYKFNGSQPFAVVSSCIRSHIRRASLCNPPYPPLFSTYELGSVPPAEDIPCLGIQPDARPVVKRGTFWFLAEAAGFPSPFPHRVQQQNSTAGGALHPSSKSSFHNGNITVSFLSQSKPKNDEKPLTRAQAHAKPQLQARLQPLFPTNLYSAPNVSSPLSTVTTTTTTTTTTETTAQAPGDVSMEDASDPLGRGKRKRTTSATVTQQQQQQSSKQSQQIPLLPKLLPAVGSPSSTQQPDSPANSTPTADRKTRQGTGNAIHRRSQSTSASDAQKPLPGLRKLKLRLGTLPEQGAQTISTPSKPLTKAQLKVQRRQQALATAAAKAAATGSSTQMQPNGQNPVPMTKRQRTQSMSAFPANNTATFPFDNLHLYHNNTHSTSNLHNTSIPGSGTVFPLDMHNLTSSPSSPYRMPQHFPHPLDLLTSRSVPENHLFGASTPTSTHVAGPFSRRGSPIANLIASAAMHKHRSASLSINDTSGAPSALEYDEYDEHAEAAYDGWGAGSRSLTDSAILAAQHELAVALSGAAEGGDVPDNFDFHEAMLKDDSFDFEFDYSLDNLEDSTRQRSATSEHFPDHVADVSTVSEDSKKPGSPTRRGSSTLDLKSLSDDVDGIFEGLNAPSSTAGTAAGEPNQDAAAQEAEVEHLLKGEDDGLDDEALQAALNTTLCPAANGKPSRLLPQNNKGPQSPLLRPNPISRSNSRDILNTPVPLAELPSLALQSSSSNPILLYASANEENTMEEPDSESRSETSSILTPLIKAEEDSEELGDLDLQDSTAPTSRSLSRSLSSMSSEETSSADTFNAEAMVYTRSGSELLDMEHDLEQTASRSQSSSRATSLSPRDSFSPQNIGPNADWALTPPSEEEHIDEEEKNLDRAALLGPESVGMDDLDDAWPGSRSYTSSEGTLLPGHDESCDSTATDRTERDAGSTAKVPDTDVFEPVLPLAPLPQTTAATSFPASHSVTAPATTTPTSPVEAAETVDVPMDIDVENSNETSAAAMFIADDAPIPIAPSSTSSSSSALTDLGDDSKRSSPAESSPAKSPSAIKETPSASPIANNPTGSTQYSGPVSQQDSPIFPNLTTPPPGDASTPAQVPAAATQSFLFYPETPFQPDITILLTDTKILFYSTLVMIDGQHRPLLRRVDNDAVDAEPLLLSLQGSTDLDVERLDALRKIKELGNTWVSLEFARELLSKFGGVKPVLDIFLADNILLSWNEKLVKLGTMLRLKNGLPTPVPSASGVSTATLAQSLPSPIAPAATPMSATTSKASASASPSKASKSAKASTAASKASSTPSTPVSNSSKNPKSASASGKAASSNKTKEVASSRRSTRNKT